MIAATRSRSRARSWPFRVVLTFAITASALVLPASAASAVPYSQCGNPINSQGAAASSALIWGANYSLSMRVGGFGQTAPFAASANVWVNTKSATTSFVPFVWSYAVAATLHTGNPFNARPAGVSVVPIGGPLSLNAWYWFNLSVPVSPKLSCDEPHSKVTYTINNGSVITVAGNWLDVTSGLHQKSPAWTRVNNQWNRISIITATWGSTITSGWAAPSGTHYANYNNFAAKTTTTVTINSYVYNPYTYVGTYKNSYHPLA